MDIEQARFNMIEQQIRPWDVLDPLVLAALAKVPREAFVPAQHRLLAFTDTDIALPGGQLMLQPKLQARLVQELQLSGRERVLEVGTGSGYTAALMAQLAPEVVTLERDAELAQGASRGLQQAGVKNVTVLHGDAAQAGTVVGPFQAVLLSGSVHRVPSAWLQWLADGGRLVAIEGQEPVMRAVRYTRHGERFERVELFDTVAPALVGLPTPTPFVF